MKKELNETKKNNKKEDIDYNNILNFFYEVGMLKRNPRSGWLVAHVKHPESIADHTARSVFVGYILAFLEGADPKEVALICAFHELGEARISDLHKLQNAYFTNKKEVETKAVKDQLNLLPKEIAKDMGYYLLNEGTDNSKEQIVAKDADYLECSIQAKEYLEQGFTHAQLWIDNSKKCVRTKSAKIFLDMLDKSNSQDWYKNISIIKRLS